MKKLYYSVCSLATPHMDILLNAIGNDLEAGHDVTFAYCNGAMHSCYKNKDSNAGLCKLCKFTYNTCILKKLKGVNIYPVSSISKQGQYDDLLGYSMAQELKSIEYRDVNVGMAVLSHYYTQTRKIEIELNDKEKRYFDTLIKECCSFIDKIYNVIEEVSPDCIAFHNGRYYENRPLLDIAKKKGIKFESLEVIGGPRTGKSFLPVKFTNCLPHDIHWFAKNAEKVWNISEDTEDKKKEISTSFYEKRRHGLSAGDYAYTKNQQEGLLPEVDSSKINIVVFNSSTDEMAAVGDEWESMQLFDSQCDTLDFILEALPRNYHVYLRIHPNLANVQEKHHTDLYVLEKKYCNITIIPPTSPISSYALMDIADKVLVFGSTMGVESCYWGKPVILVGAAFYLDLDVCYRASDKESLIGYLLADLKPKEKEGCLKYAYYLLDYKYRVEPISKNMDTDFDSFTINLFGIKLIAFRSYTIWKSPILFKLIVVAWRQWAKWFIANRNVMPV